MTKINLQVKNPQNPKKLYKGEFLVDSGATFTVVPKTILQKLGIKPVREETFFLADGRTIKRKIGHALYGINSTEGAAPVLFGEKDDSRLLGVFTLEALGFSLDPLKRKLYKAHLTM